MKATVDAKDLARALTSARRVIPSRGTVPILSNVLVQTDKDLTLTVTDMDLRFTQKLEADVAEAGEDTVDLATFAIFAAGLNGEMILEPNGSRLRASTDRARCDLATLPAGDFPTDMGTGDEFGCQFTMAGETLSECLTFCQPAVCKNETRPYLCGTHLAFNGKLVFVSTDGHRLQKIEVEPPLGSEKLRGLDSIIVPGNVAAFLSRAVTVDALVNIGNTLLSVDFGSAKLVSKLIDGTFPDYEQVIPEPSSETIRVDRKALLSAVHRASSLAESETEGRPIYFSSTADDLLVRAIKDVSVVQECVSCEGVAAEFTIISTNIRDALESLACETVVLHLNDGPVQIEGDDPTRTALVMKYLKNWPSHLEAA